MERLEAHADEAAVADEVDVVAEFLDGEADRGDGEAVADELFFESDGLSHGGAEVLAEFVGPDLGVLINEVLEELAEEFDVVRLVAERVADHLADAGEFVLAVEGEDHAEEAVELGAFHALAEEEHVFRERGLVGGIGEIGVAAEGAAVGDDEIGFFLDGGDVLEHGLALVRVDAERADHVNERIGVDVFLLGVAAEGELELRRGDGLADDMEDVVADDAFGGGEVADAHLDDPAVHIGDGAGGVAPVLAILLHLDVLGLPVVGFHLFVDVVGPSVFQGEDVEKHGLAAIDDAFGGVGSLGLVAVEDEGAVSECDGGGGHGGWVFGFFWRDPGSGERGFMGLAAALPAQAGARITSRGPRVKQKNMM